jgi:hypothetical protein
MKYIFTITTFLCLFAFSKQIISKNNFVPYQNASDSTPVKNKTSSKNSSKLIYDFPEDVTTDTGRASFLKDFFKGKIIYKQTCAKCHDSTKNGKLYYPDFSLPQLLDYEMRFQYPQHQEDLRETNITASELDMVVIFLHYKKNNLLADKK